jgi:hypothetical protein
MAINFTSKEKPTGDGNPTAGGAINNSDFPSGQRSGKAFGILRAAFTMRGHSLHRTDLAERPETFRAERLRLVKQLPTVDAARRFLEQMGGRL